MRGTRTTARTRTLLAAPLIALALLTVTSCEDSGGSGSGYGAGPVSPSAEQPSPEQPSADVPAGTEAPAEAAPDPAPEPAPATVTVKTAESELGTILVDAKGRTLYGFTKDKPGQATCDADCIAVWPALISATDVTAGPGTEAALLKETKLGTGAEQAVYGDWPLYYYVGDVTPGDVNGQGLDGEWFVIAADGKLIKKEAETVV
ncbi:COG4315 family predicted lipoprotein [Streptomyces sp. NPDC002867]